MLSTSLTAATGYYVVVSKFATPAPTAGNTAVQLRIVQNLPPGSDACSAPAVLTLNLPVTGAWSSAAVIDYQLTGAACFTGVGQTATTAPGPDLLYTFTAPAAGNYSFRLNGSAGNAALYVASSWAAVRRPPRRSPTTPPPPPARRSATSTRGRWPPPFNFSLSLSRPSALAVQVTATSADVSATQPSDYAPLAATVQTLAAGVVGQGVTVNVNGDGIFEANETFQVNLTVPVGASIGDPQGIDTIQNDDAPCTFTPQANLSLSNAPGQCSAVVSFGGPTPAGGCGIVTCAPASGSTFPVGGTLVTCTAQSGATSAFTVTVNDTQAPTITQGDIAAGTDPGVCAALVTISPTVQDNCPGATAVCTPPSGSSFAAGTTPASCTATDGASLTATANFNVVVTDDEAPVIGACPVDVVVPGTSGGVVVNFTDPTFSDNCPGAAVSCVPPSGSLFPIGTTAVDCVAADGVNLTDACAFDVQVGQAPIVEIPALGPLGLLGLGAALAGLGAAAVRRRRMRRE